MATSPGGRGGATVLGIAKGSFQHMGGNVVADFSLPSFNSNFSDGKIIDDTLNTLLSEAVTTFEQNL